MVVVIAEHLLGVGVSLGHQHHIELSLQVTLQRYPSSPLRSGDQATMSYFVSGFFKLEGPCQLHQKKTNGFREGAHLTLKRDVE